MNLLLIGAGGVGQSVAMIIKKAESKGIWLEKMVVADYDLERANAVVNLVNDQRYVAEKLNAGSKEDIIKMVKKHGSNFTPSR